MAEPGIAQALLRLALSLGPAFSGNPASMPSLISGGGFSRGFTPKMDAFLAQNYPSDFAPGKYHVYDVHHIPGRANNNSLGRANMSTITEAGRMQTLKEHNDALNKYIMPNMNPKQRQAAIELGRTEEKKLPQFWNESSQSVNKNRAQFSVSSSAVSGIRLTPDGRVQVRWKNKKGDSQWYTYRQYPDVQQASVAAQELLASPSIGRAVMPFQRKGRMLNFKNPAAYSDWSVNNYDPGFA